MTSGSNGNYTVTLPDITFSGGGTLSSGTGNAGGGNGNFSTNSDGAGNATFTVTNAGATTALISAGKLGIQHNSLTFNVGSGTAASQLTVSGSIVDVNGSNKQVIKNGSGILTFTGTDTYGGGTLVNAGTLAAGSNSALSTGTVTLAGGALAASRSGLSVATGALKLTAGASTLDFGTGNTGNKFSFLDSSTQSWTGTLNILNWVGTPAVGGVGTYNPADPDMLFIGSGATLTPSQLSDITFSIGGVSAGAVQLSNGEVIANMAAAPEPSQLTALLMAGLGLCGLALRAKRRTGDSMAE